MITHDFCLIFVGEESSPDGYTQISDNAESRIIGLKSRNIHVHLGQGWEKLLSLEQLEKVRINLRANPNLAWITVGDFDPFFRDAMYIRAICKKWSRA